MPDGARERFVPVVHVEPRAEPQRGFTPGNTSGLNGRELAALNLALDRLVEAGLSEWDAKVRLDQAVRVWLAPRDAGTMELDRLLLGHEGAMWPGVPSAT